MEKPPVTIRLVLQTERLIHGGGVGRGTIDWKDIQIRWEGNDTAVVETQKVPLIQVTLCNNPQSFIFQKDPHVKIHALIAF
jgi:hypothetical protein